MGKQLNMSSKEASNRVFELIDQGLTQQLLEVLEAQPALVNSVSENKQTVFEKLLESGYNKVASSVVAFEEFDVNHPDHNPLRASIATGNIDLAIALLKKGASPNYRPAGMSSALLLCLEHEYFDLAEVMVECGAEVDIRNQLGWTPLIWASIKGRVKAVEFLLKHGANIHACNNDGWNAVTGAYFKKRINIVKLLLEKGAVFSEKYAEAALLSAYEGGHKEVYTYLIEELHTNPNVSDDKDISLLAKAVTRGDWAMVELLIKHKADPNVVDAEGIPLIAILATNGRKQLIELFLNNGADVHLSSNKGQAAIHMAAAYNQVEVLGYLIERGANVDAQTESGWTSLMIAADGGYLDMVKKLLACRANPLLKTNKGSTAKQITRSKAPRTERYKELQDSAYKDIVELLTLPGHIIDA